MSVEQIVKQNKKPLLGLVKCAQMNSFDMIKKCYSSPDCVAVTGMEKLHKMDGSLRYSKIISMFIPVGVRKSNGTVFMFYQDNTIGIGYTSTVFLPLFKEGAEIMKKYQKYFDLN